MFMAPSPYRPLTQLGHKFVRPRPPPGPQSPPPAPIPLPSDRSVLMTPPETSTMATGELKNKHGAEYPFLHWGRTSRVIQLSGRIALKCSIRPDERGLNNEKDICDELQRRSPCPHIVSSFLRMPGLNFMPLLRGGSLEGRIRTRQRRDTKTDQVLQVDGSEPEHLILRWIQELASAAAWLESLDLVHGDIHPTNLLLDEEDHLKMADFDSTHRIGTRLEDCGTHPYRRLVGKEGGMNRGTSGLVGSRTEQFAIGTVLYTLTRGYEPYSDQWYGLDHRAIVVEMLQDMEFPHIEVEDDMDFIIYTCWYFEFTSVRAVEQAVKALGCQQVDKVPVVTDQVIMAGREESKRLMEVFDIQALCQD